MLGTGQQHWSTVHVADLADFFRRALEDESARGRYIIGGGSNPTVAELTEAAAVAGRRSGSGRRLRR
jgi:nucleoside-diphosphate-sugar epimerase